MRVVLVPSLIAGLMLGACSPSTSDDRIAPDTAGKGGTSAGGGGKGGSVGSSGGSAGGSSTGGSAGASVAGSGGGAATGGSAGGAGSPGGSGGSAAVDSSPGETAAEPVAPGAFPGCPKCKSIFDGKTLDGWQQDPAGSFEVKDGVIASTGPGAHAWTKEDYGDYRIIFSVRQIRGNHKPCTTLFTTRPTGKASRGLSGIQFQPPLGGSWDYRPGKNSGPNATNWTYPNPRPMFTITKWHRCEIVARASTGEFRGACCEIEGQTSCKGIEVLRYKDASAGKKGPFALMMHNGGLFDEFKDLYVETDPVGDELVTMK